MISAERLRTLMTSLPVRSPHEPGASVALARALETLAADEREDLIAYLRQQDGWSDVVPPSATADRSFHELTEASRSRPALYDVRVTRSPSSPFVAVPELASDPSPTHAFIRWVDVQVAAVPELEQVHAQVLEMLRRDDRPQRVGELYARVIGFASAEVAGRSDLDADQRQHLAGALACVALAAQVMNVKGGSWDNLPHFIPDARPGSFGYDATGHLICQCMFAYVTLYDAAHGSGKVKASFEAVADQMDAAGRSGAITAAYDRVRGRAGPLTPGALAGPPLQTETYFARPIGMSAEEAAAYDAAVRVGSAYEHLSTPVEFRGYDPERLGTHPELEDPFARVLNTIGDYAGLSDGDVTRDLTANRVGAFTAVQLFRRPAATPEIPWDVGAQWETPAFASRAHIPFGEYFALESKLLDAAGAPRRTTQEPQSPSEAIDQLRDRLDALVDSTPDRDRLALFYANFSLRQLRWRVPMGTPGLESGDFDGHVHYARNVERDTLKWEFGLRLAAIAQRIG